MVVVSIYDAMQNGHFTRRFSPTDFTFNIYIIMIAVGYNIQINEDIT